MSLQPLIPVLVLALVASVTGMVAGASGEGSWLLVASAGLFTAAVLGVALAVNRPYWTAAAALLPPAEITHAARRNTRLAALVYAWGAAAIMAVYQLSDLAWYHFYQYGLGAALIALGLLVYVHRMAVPDRTPPPPLWATAAHGIAVAAGLAFLLGSGKIWSTRADWAANVVFVFGGVAIIAICILALVTQSRLPPPARTE